MKEVTQQLYERVLTEIMSPRLDAKTREELADELSEVESRLLRLEEQEFSDFLSHYLVEHPDDEIKCGCSDSDCPLKRGEIPPELRPKSGIFARDDSDIQQARKFLKKHPKAIVIDDAKEEYQQRYAKVHSDLRKILIKAGDGR